MTNLENVNGCTECVHVKCDYGDSCTCELKGSDDSREIFEPCEEHEGRYLADTGSESTSDFENEEEWEEDLEEDSEAESKEEELYPFYFWPEGAAFRLLDVETRRTLRRERLQHRDRLHEKIRLRLAQLNVEASGGNLASDVQKVFKSYDGHHSGDEDEPSAPKQKAGPEDDFITDELVDRYIAEAKKEQAASMQKFVEHKKKEQAHFAALQRLEEHNEKQRAESLAKQEREGKDDTSTTGQQQYFINVLDGMTPEEIAEYWSKTTPEEHYWNCKVDTDESDKEDYGSEYGSEYGPEYGSEDGSENGSEHGSQVSDREAESQLVEAEQPLAAQPMIEA